MRAAALRVELHLPSPQSLKAKRAILRPMIEGIKRLGSFSVAEVDHHDSWQRTLTNAKNANGAQQLYRLARTDWAPAYI